MIFEPAELPGVWRVRLEPATDERGAFVRVFCADEFAAHGLPAVFEQSSMSRNTRAGTLRGMHYQSPPNEEAKLVRCARGAVFDVVVDLRPEAPTHRRWLGETLSADDGLALFVPPGFAHGFVTLTDDADVLYQITPAFRPGHGRGVRWDDPAFGISWPVQPSVMSDRDASYPDYAG